MDGQITPQMKREAQKLQRQHAAEQSRKQRYALALETQDESKQGQKIWIIPEFDADQTESEHIVESVREALPAYHCQLAHAPEVSEEDIYQLMTEKTPTGDH